LRNKFKYGVRKTNVVRAPKTLLLAKNMMHKD